MKVAIIGRTEVLYDTALRLDKAGHKIVCILTTKEAPEYTRTAKDFRKLAAAWRIPFEMGGHISKHAKILQKVRADIGVSINYTSLIPQPVIDIFPLGVLNAHGGDLPRYRGNACQAWAILNGEERIGLCIHKMIGGELDSGPIISRDFLSINYNTKVTKVWEWIKKRAPELFAEALLRLQADPSYILEAQSNDLRAALRCYPRRPEDGQINWGKSAIDVLRLINACNKPYAGAFCSYENKKLIIWDAQLVDDGELFCAQSGQVTKISSSFVEVACGSGKIKITCIEYQNRILKPNALIQSTRKRLE